MTPCVTLCRIYATIRIVLNLSLTVKKIVIVPGAWVIPRSSTLYRQIHVTLRSWLLYHMCRLKFCALTWLDKVQTVHAPMNETQNRPEVTCDEWGFNVLTLISQARHGRWGRDQRRDLA